MKHDSRLIQTPLVQPRLQRTAWGLVTVLFWVLYFYLWAPLITLLMWFLGVRAAVVELYLRNHKIEPFLLIVLPLTALVTAALLIGWAEFNRNRYSRRDRRQPLSNVAIGDVAAVMGATLTLTAALGRAKIAVLQMDPDAVPLAVADTVHLLRAPVPAAVGGQTQERDDPEPVGAEE